MKLTQYLFFLLISIAIISSCTNNKENKIASIGAAYTCPMHPQIIRNQPGNCPICGMALVKKEQKAEEIKNVPLEALLKPTNQYVVSSIPVTTIEQGNEQSIISALGSVQYDNRQIGTISSRSEGRIDRLYVKYKYQSIHAGDKILDIYSPELMTAQENYMFLLKQDQTNSSLLNAARQRLILLGMNASQINQITKSGKPSYKVSIYSNYSGLVNDVLSNSAIQGNANNAPLMNTAELSQELSIKEGMYLTKGQPIFSIINRDKALVVLNIFSSDQTMVKAGNAVKIIPETAPDKSFTGKIDLIDPFFRNQSKTVTVRIYFDNSTLRLPIGSQVQAKLVSNGQPGYWLQESSVLTLGLNHVVFKKEGVGFRAHKVEIAGSQNGKIQITAGLSPKDSVAVNAQYLIGSESFIQVKE